jgi:hypothetical protein
MEPSTCPLVPEHTFERYVDADAELRAAGYRYSFDVSQWCHPTRAPAYIRRVATLGSTGHQVTRYSIVYTAADRSPTH